LTGDKESTALDASLVAWIGRRDDRQDVLDPRLIAEFTATFAPYLTGATSVPPGLFWCLCPDIEPARELGGDGHSRLGLHLPEVGLQRRMWAGGELVFHGDFSAGDAVAKASTVEDIIFKSGSTGRLCFVTQRNRYSVSNKLILEERQDIVYREPPARDSGRASAAQPALPTPEPGDWIVTPTPTLLFRYSAMTFNGHRIHYDFPYATDVEGYAGLVVHGPMQATLMLNLAADRLGRLPGRFRYRGVAPLICDRPFLVRASAGAEGSLDMRVVAGSGATTMSGIAD
jgi:3-methylfumaryl-CoA hydratase